MKELLPVLVAAPVLIWGPQGGVDVTPTRDGYEVDDFRGGVTTITRTNKGYIVIPPNGPAEFVDLQNAQPDRKEQKPETNTEIFQ